MKKLHTERGKNDIEKQMHCRIILIAAVDAAYGIGRDGKLLFSISEDLRRFRKMTLNRTVMYGRRTLLTFPNGKPLSGRKNLILSRTLEDVDGAEVYHSLDDALQAADEILVIGGESVYRQTIDLADRIELTVIHEKKKADAFFPVPDDSWYMSSRSDDFKVEGPVFHYETWLRENVQRKPQR